MLYQSASLIISEFSHLICLNHITCSKNRKSGKTLKNLIPGFCTVSRSFSQSLLHMKSKFGNSLDLIFMKSKFGNSLDLIFIKFMFLNPFPHNDAFRRPWETSLQKTLWEKEKLLVTSDFSFSHSVFYLFE